MSVGTLKCRGKEETEICLKIEEACGLRLTTIQTDEVDDAHNTLVLDHASEMPITGGRMSSQLRSAETFLLHDKTKLCRMRTTTCLLHSREKTRCLNDRAERHQHAHQSCGSGQAHRSRLSRSSINCRGDSCIVVMLVLCKSLVMNVLPCVLYCLRKFA